MRTRNEIGFDHQTLAMCFLHTRLAAFYAPTITTYLLLGSRGWKPATFEKIGVATVSAVKFVTNVCKSVSHSTQQKPSKIRHGFELLLPMSTGGVIASRFQRPTFRESL